MKKICQRQRSYLGLLPISRRSVAMNPPLSSQFDGSAADPVVGLIDALGLPARLFPIQRLLREAIRAEAAHILRRMAIEERFDEEPADACGAGDAVRVAAARHHEAGNAVALAEDKV